MFAIVLVLLLTSPSAAAQAVPAPAARAWVAGARVMVTADDADNDLLVEDIAADGVLFYRVTDRTGRPVESGPGCEATHLSQVVCGPGGRRGATVALGGGDDRVEVDSYYRVRVDGGDGDDTLLGGERRNGPVTFNGGHGADTADYAQRFRPLRLTLNGSRDDGEVGEYDLVGADVETLIGGADDDTIRGNGRANVLVGGPGSDWLDGRGGDDHLDGFDYEWDVLRCGSGDDVAAHDSADDLLACERASRR